MGTASRDTASVAVYAADEVQRERLTVLARAAGCRVACTVGTARALRHLTAEISVDAIVAAWAHGEDRDTLRAAHRAPMIVVMDDDGIAPMREALAAGAMAVLPSDTAANELRLAVDALKRGLCVLPQPLLAATPAKPRAQPRDAPAEAEALTARELEVVAAMADGASNKAIARRLGISFHTVKFHVASVLEKLDADTRTEAVAEAARRGLVML